MTTTASPTTPETITPATDAPESADDAINLDEIASDVRAATGMGRKERPAGDEADALSETVERYADEAAEPVAEGVTFDTATNRYRNASGQFVKKDGSPEEATATADAAPPPDAEAPTDQATTEGTTEKGAKEKAAPFVAYGEDGQPLAALPVKEWEIKINGEQRKVDTEKLVRLAQSGGYNEELHVELKQIREYTPQVEQYAQTLEQQVQAMQQHVAQLYQNPDFYVQQVEQFEQAQTPEARAQRLEQELSAVRQREAQQVTAQQLAQAVQTQILPKFEQILATYPEVRGEELVAHLDTLVAPYRQPNGQVHPSHLPTVHALLDRAVTPFAAQLHEARSDAKALRAAQEAHAKAAQDAAARTAQEAAQKVQAHAHQQVADAKRQLARQIAPSGGVSTSVPARPKPTSFNDTRAMQRSVEDAVNAVLGG